MVFGPKAYKPEKPIAVRWMLGIDCGLSLFMVVAEVLSSRHRVVVYRTRLGRWCERRPSPNMAARSSAVNACMTVVCLRGRLAGLAASGGADSPLFTKRAGFHYAESGHNRRRRARSAEPVIAGLFLTRCRHLSINLTVWSAPLGLHHGVMIMVTPAGPARGWECVTRSRSRACRHWMLSAVLAGSCSPGGRGTATRSICGCTEP